MNKRNRGMLAGAAGAMLLLSGSGFALSALSPSAADASGAPEGTIHTSNGNTIDASWLDLGDEAGYVRASDVQGTFVFNQLGTTPNDELFNVFGAALTSMCSKPAVELATDGEGAANYYVNVGGHIEKNLTIDVSELAEDASEETLMACSCATGAPLGQAAVLGVPLSSIVEMADLEEGVNTITAYGADGFGQPLPLRYALEKNAMLVYQVNGQELTTATEGSSLQLWMPETVARYFTRNITDIELTREESVPEVQGADPCYRNKINIMNYADGCAFAAGDEITFEGVADDLGSPITAIEFTFDGGRTWTTCETEGATADKWVNWQFTTSFEQTGDYEMTVRAKTADGNVSPLAATLLFTVS